MEGRKANWREGEEKGDPEKRRGKADRPGREGREKWKERKDDGGGGGGKERGNETVVVVGGGRTGHLDLTAQRTPGRT